MSLPRYQQLAQDLSADSRAKEFKRSEAHGISQPRRAVHIDTNLITYDNSQVTIEATYKSEGVAETARSTKRITDGFDHALAAAESHAIEQAGSSGQRRLEEAHFLNRQPAMVKPPTGSNIVPIRQSASRRQLNFLLALARERDLTPDWIRDESSRRFGETNLESLDRRQVLELVGVVRSSNVELQAS